MNRLAALVIVMTLPATARADMGPPWPTRDVRVRVTITADPPPPGHEWFVTDTTITGGATKVWRLSPTEPLILDTSRREAFFLLRVYQVSSPALAEFGNEVPPSAWCNGANELRCKHLGSGGIKRGVDFFDVRGLVELEYRVENRSDRPWVVKVSDNERSIGFQRISALVGCCGLPVGIAWLGLWLVRRLFRPSARPPVA